MDHLIEKTKERSTAFQGCLLHLDVDTVILPDGKEGVREYIRHPGGVGIVALTEDNEVLLVKQYRYAYSEVVTEIPAGKRDPGEEPLTTGMRELEEETGYRAEHYTSLGCLYPTPGCCDEIVYLYLATGLTQSEAHLDEDEFLDVERCPLDEMVQRVMAGEITDAKTQIAILKTKLLLDSRKEGVE